MVVITENWTKKVEKRKDFETNLSLGHDLGLLTRTREALDYGGVAIIWKETLGLFREVTIQSPQGFRVLVAAGSLTGHSRKVLVIACYGIYRLT